MDVIYEADGLVNFLADDFEVPHAPGPEEYWQESFVLYYWDDKTQTNSFLRFGQTPNYKGGTAQVMCNIWTPEGFYKHSDDEVSFDASCRTANSITDGKRIMQFEYDGNFNWKINDEQYDVSADLVLKPYHTGISYIPGDNEFTRQLIANHSQAYGNVVGEITLKGKTYQINCHGWRDHSYGIRNWLSNRGHRFFPSIFDKDTYMTATTFVGADGKLTKCAVLGVGGKLVFTTDIKVIAYMGEDLISNCGGNVILNALGEHHVFDYSAAYKSSVISVHGSTLTECPCRVSYGDRAGVGLTETTTNPQLGSEQAFVFPDTPGIMENGVHLWS